MTSSRTPGRAATRRAACALLFGEATDATGEPDHGRAAALRARHPELIAAQLAPSPPVSAGVAAALAGATAMLDVSDGLARDARRLAEASGVGLDFDSAALGADVRLALAGAEDHGLLATFPPHAVLPAEFEPIGRVVDAAGRLFVDAEPVGCRGLGSLRRLGRARGLIGRAVGLVIVAHVGGRPPECGLAVVATALG